MKYLFTAIKFCSRAEFYYRYKNSMKLVLIFKYDKYKNILKKHNYTCFVILNLNGGPSKTAIVLSSEPVIILNGRFGRKSQEFIGFDWPDISPTDVPVSDMKT